MLKVELTSKKICDRCRKETTMTQPMFNNASQKYVGICMPCYAEYQIHKKCKDS